MKRPAAAVILAVLAMATDASAQRFPLKTDGARIVDQQGVQVRLRGVNWFGAESGAFVVGGLDRQPLHRLAALIRKAGFNSVRLPWSNEMVETNPRIDPARLAANPDLSGRSALEVFDAVVDALGAEGLMVVLDNHRSRADWCCDEQHGDGLWHTADYPEAAWLADWRTMTARYADRPFVIAAELRNEIRPDPSQDLVPTWGDGSTTTDWRQAAMRGGEAVLSVNPRLLIIVGGLAYQEHLREAGSAPVRLSVPHRLVYAAHDYAWWRTPEELRDPILFADRSRDRWAYLTEGPDAVPVYISEWGGCLQPGPAAQPCRADRAAYVRAFARYAADSGIDWAYWPLNGTQSPGYGRTDGAVETYGLLDPTWTRFVAPDLLALLNPVVSGSRP